MEFIPAAIIKKKRMGEALAAQEIDFLIESYTKGVLPDYQMSAFLMAVYYQGMTDFEIHRMTSGIIQSGISIDLSDVPGTKIDKHSTGGIGDKTSLILAPIVAACGVPVPMMSGRGLGHTGGTLDKLESIPGFQTQLSVPEFKKLLIEKNMALIGQTLEICPADKKLYALRDVTATVESLPLICSSIMSKKIAEGIDGLVLDVKFGSGAFMKKTDDARALAKKLISVGEKFGKRTIAFLTRMDQPLGRWIGNAVEVQESLEILENTPEAARKYADCRELSLKLSAAMIWLGSRASDLKEGYQLALDSLTSGEALKKFKAICLAQGGVLEKLPRAAHEKVLVSPRDGFVVSFNAETLGLAALTLGAGRRMKEDSIDPTAGIYFHAKMGERVFKGQPLFTLYGQDPSKFAFAEALLFQATMLNADAAPVEPLVLEILSKDGVLSSIF